MAQRIGEIRRKTKETEISLSLNIDGTGERDISCGVPFFEHMLDHVAKHGFFDLKLQASGDIEIDDHHTVEDIGICLGRAFHQALGNKEGIVRYGTAFVPMMEALVMVSVDLSGRPYLGYEVEIGKEKIGAFDTELVEEFFRAFCSDAGINMHIRLLAGTNAHHIAEAIFKAFGKAMDAATRYDDRIQGALSTKGLF